MNPIIPEPATHGDDPSGLPAWLDPHSLIPAELAARVRSACDAAIDIIPIVERIMAAREAMFAHIGSLVRLDGHYDPDVFYAGIVAGTDAQEICGSVHADEHHHRVRDRAARRRRLRTQDPGEVAAQGGAGMSAPSYDNLTDWRPGDDLPEMLELDPWAWDWCAELEGLEAILPGDLARIADAGDTAHDDRYRYMTLVDVAEIVGPLARMVGDLRRRVTELESQVSR